MRRSIVVNQKTHQAGIFKKLFGRCATALLFCFPLSFSANAIIFNYANLTNTVINFSGGGFNFTSNNTGYQFDITSVMGGVGDAVGLDAYIVSSGFTIGTIGISGPLQTAPVLGTGILHITDANHIDLTATIQWDDIATFGSGGVMNLSGVVNLSGISYAGLNNDLQALTLAGSAADVATFQFIPGKTLTELANSGGSSSYSGGISPVPEPATLTLMGMGFAGLLVYRRNRSK